MAVLAGELSAWPSKEGMAAILRSAGLAATVGRYSVRVEGHPHFTFHEYVGDEEDYIDEFRLSGGVLEYRRVHSGYYLPVRNFLRSRGVRQTPNQALQQTGGA